MCGKTYVTLYDPHSQRWRADRTCLLFWDLGQTRAHQGRDVLWRFHLGTRNTCHTALHLRTVRFCRSGIGIFGHLGRKFGFQNETKKLRNRIVKQENFLKPRRPRNLKPSSENVWNTTPCFIYFSRLVQIFILCNIWFFVLFHNLAFKTLVIKENEEKDVESLLTFKSSASRCQTVGLLYSTRELLLYASWKSNNRKPYDEDDYDIQAGHELNCWISLPLLGNGRST